MNFLEFKTKCERNDGEFNDLNHFFSNKPGLYFAFYLDKLRLTPNQITLIFISVGLLSAVLLGFGYIFFSYLLWRLHIILDIADGNVARKQKLFSDLGPLLDKIGHHLIYPSTVFSFIIYLDLQEKYPIMSLVLYVLFIGQWSLKYLHGKKKFLQDSGSFSKNFIKRILINLMGIEGMYIALILNYFNFINPEEFLFLFIFTSFFMLSTKIFVILSNGLKY